MEVQEDGVRMGRRDSPFAISEIQIANSEWP
jgi:hypothetical protein